MSTSRLAENAGETALFDPEESVLIDRGLSIIAAQAPDDVAELRALLERYSALNIVLRESPSLRETQQLAGDERNEPSLVDHLCEIDGLTGDLDLPMKAVLSRSSLTAKIQLLRAFVHACDGLLSVDETPLTRQLDTEMRDELAQSIYTLIAEELLLALLRKPDVRLSTKREAVDQLIAIWEDADLEIDDFCPLLEAAWRARNRVSVDLGSLLGTSELFQLVSEDCPHPFVDFFCRDTVSTGERQAFEEFLFEMTFEEMSVLRQAMRDRHLDSITTDLAGELIGRRIEQESHDDHIDPVCLYRSYNRRQLAADFRIVAGTDGPRRTAEAYLMIYLLDQREHK